MSDSIATGRAVLYAAGGFAGAALAASAFLLTREGMQAGDAVLAALPPAALLGFLALAARYPCRAMPLRRSSATRVVVTHLASAAVASGIWVVAWEAWRPQANRTLFAALAFMFYLMAVAMHYLVLELDAARRAEEAALRYEVLAREAQLKAFKAQIDPHFLFNSLNAVASLCGSRPQDARQMSQLLADFFRQTLRLGGLERITLAQEIDLVSRYLAIEKIRFGDRLAIRVEVEDGVAGTIVPPLLLQPLVENAVRHGVASMVDGGTIHVDARERNGAVAIVVDNPADPDRAGTAGEGIGLENVRGRLGAFFGGRGSMRAEESGGRYRVEIEVPR